jgi:hypothetical protein
MHYLISCSAGEKVLPSVFGGFGREKRGASPAFGRFRIAPASRSPALPVKRPVLHLFTAEFLKGKLIQSPCGIVR